MIFNQKNEEQAVVSGSQQDRKFCTKKRPLENNPNERLRIYISYYLVLTVLLHNHTLPLSKNDFF
jgi:hypothetical protein